jgi:acetylornithine deacetylase
MDSIDILRQLIAFPTISRDSNLQLANSVRDQLAERGIACVLVGDATGAKANLYATIGPADRPGVLLSGHTDVVPVDGQEWTCPPFALTRRHGRLYGRGAADMKGFLACALAAALQAADRELRSPLHLAFSYDEEVGCIGVRRLIDVLAEAPVRPAFCIVGEPTSMAVATGHKGKTALRATCIGREAHSALAPLAVNALHLGCDLVGAIRARQAEIAEAGARDGDYDVPYTTLHVGRMSGGTALNIVPNRCEVEFEIRNLAEDDPASLAEELRGEAERIAAAARERAPEAAIRIEVENSYPGLGTAPDAEVVAFVKSLTGANRTIKVAFGTEGGLYSERLGIPTVVCGPGSMAQGHRPDEYVSEEQMARCDAMLAALLDRLEAGLGYSSPGTP